MWDRTEMSVGGVGHHGEDEPMGFYTGSVKIHNVVEGYTSLWCSFIAIRMTTSCSPRLPCSLTRGFAY